MIYFGENALRYVPEHVSTVYALVMNPMRGRTEEQRLLAIADDRDELVAYVKAEEVETYTTEAQSSFDGLPHKFRHVYREGGPLQWFNPPEHVEGPADHWGFGIIQLRRDGWRRTA